MRDGRVVVSVVAESCPENIDVGGDSSIVQCRRDDLRICEPGVGGDRDGIPYGRGGLYHRGTLFFGCTQERHSERERR